MSVTYDNQVKDAFMVKRDNGPIMEFVPSAEGLYYYNFEQSIKRKQEQEAENTMIVKTVEGVQRNVAKQEIEVQKRHAICM